MSVNFKMQIETINPNNTSDIEVISEFKINGHMPSKEKVKEYFYNLLNENNININGSEDKYLTLSYLPKSPRHENYAFAYTYFPEERNKIFCLFVNESNTRARL